MCCTTFTCTRLKSWVYIFMRVPNPTHIRTIPILFKHYQWGFWRLHFWAICVHVSVYLHFRLVWTLGFCQLSKSGVLVWSVNLSSLFSRSKRQFRKLFSQCISVFEHVASVEAVIIPKMYKMMTFDIQVNAHSVKRIIITYNGPETIISF